MKLVCCPDKSSCSNTNGTARRMLKGHPTIAATEKQMTAFIAGSRFAETGSVAKLNASMMKCIEKLEGRKAERLYQIRSRSDEVGISMVSLVAEWYIPALRMRKNSV